jgi:glycosyltransferase involved in cell wall biosynthesis
MSSEQLSICMVTTFYPPLHFGGDAAYAYQLTNALARRGHNVTVVHSADAYGALGGKEAAGGFEHARGVTVRRLETRAPKGSALATYLFGRPLVYARQLHEALDGDRYDVIHFHNVSLAGGPGVLGYGDAVKLYTTSEHWLVCPMHVLFRYNREPCEEPKCLRCSLAFRRPPQLWRYGGLLERSVKHVDLFLSPSRFTLEAHRARGFTEPMRHLPYFYSDVGHEPAGDGEEAPSRPYFLYVGRLERLKGVQVLIDLFREYRRADLLIVGEGTLDEDLRRQAAGLEHVRFLGRLHPSQLGPLYAGAAALLVPSIGYEVFGIVVLEAFARRTPAIAHDLGALTEVIEDSEGGLLYRTTAELREAMDRMLDDEELRGQLGVRGHEAWRRLWSEDVHVAGYYDAIEEARRLRVG